MTTVLLRKLMGVSGAWLAAHSTVPSIAGRGSPPPVPAPAQKELGSEAEQSRADGESLCEGNGGI